ncbi:MAG TPA: 50S ribosomal protein L10, partial [Actinomycetota bacterium]|nr:50S ribosomal protein L10 [Actinomycetota bacterium]
MARPEKVAAVDEIRERFEQADAALLTEYRGLRVAEIAEVRGALREAGAEYKVLKNTLARIAVREVGLEELVGMLEGPTAIVFVDGDVAAAAKALDEAAKKYPVLVVKGGTLKGGKIFDADQAQALAKIEPREVLLAKVAMLANSPAQQAANVFSALLRNLGSMLAQVVTKKETEEPAGEAQQAEEAPAETATPEEVGVPSPDADTSEGKGESSEESPAPEATAAETPEAAENEASEP